jgi:glycerophosphoryl diester phosphodiesterase
VLQDGLGVDVTGTGDPNNPYVVEFDGSEVVAQGLTWDSSVRKLSAKLAPGGGLEFDAGGAIRSTVTGGGEEVGWTTIADLEARGANVVIGHAGAGYLVKPETARRSYEYGQQIGVDAMHVPVRMLMDGTPVVHSDETLGRTHGEPWNAAAWQAIHVQEIDGHRWGIVPMLSGLDSPYLRNQPDGNTDPTIEFNAAAWADNAKWQTRSPSFGFLGNREQPQYGGTFLADVFRDVGGRTPLIIDLRWPARTGGNGAFVRSTPAWRTDLFLRNTLSMIQRFGLSSYVVVTSDQITIPAQVVGQTVNVLDYFSSAGIRVGPQMTSANVSTYPPSSWPATWSWAFFPTTISDATIATYAALTPGGNPLRRVLLQVQRQTVWRDRITTPGLLGGTSADPVYAYGLVGGTHPLSGLGYRRNWSDWGQATVQHGLIPPAEGATRVSPYLRGLHEPGVDRTLFGPQMVPVVSGTGYHVLQGRLGPLPVPTDVSFDFVLGMDEFESPRVGGWLGFTFGRVDDSQFTDWNPAPGANAAAQSGYLFLMNGLNTATDAVNPNLYLYGYQGSAVVTIGSARTLTPVAAGAGKRFRIGVNNKGLRISAVQGDGSLVTLIESRTDLAKAHRGPYMHLGRRSQTSAGWYGWCEGFTWTAFAGAVDGPQ